MIGKVVASCLAFSFSASLFAQTYVDAYRVDPDGKVFEMYRVEMRDKVAKPVIDDIEVEILWDLIDKIIVDNEEGGNVTVRNTIVLRDGRIFENVRYNSYPASWQFTNFLVDNPVTDDRMRHRIRNPPTGSIIELRAVSGGIRTDGRGNVWPAHYYYSPITGESLGPTPKTGLRE